MDFLIRVIEDTITACLSGTNYRVFVCWIKISVGSEVTFALRKQIFHDKSAIQEGSGALEQKMKPLFSRIIFNNPLWQAQYSPLSQLTFGVIYIDLKEVSILPISKLNGSISLGSVEIKVLYSFGIRSLHANQFVIYSLLE